MNLYWEVIVPEILRTLQFKGNPLVSYYRKFEDKYTQPLMDFELLRSEYEKIMVGLNWLGTNDQLKDFFWKTVGKLCEGHPQPKEDHVFSDSFKWVVEMVSGDAVNYNWTVAEDDFQIRAAWKELAQNIRETEPAVIADGMEEFADVFMPEMAMAFDISYLRFVKQGNYDKEQRSQAEIRKVTNRQLRKIQKELHCIAEKLRV